MTTAIITTILICVGAVAVDGDTLRCANGPRIRLLGVAAPELRDQYGRESKATLARLVDGHDLACVPSGASADRIVASCWPLGPDIGEAMVVSGLARSCPAYDTRYDGVDANPLDMPRAPYCEVHKK